MNPSCAFRPSGVARRWALSAGALCLAAVACLPARAAEDAATNGKPAVNMALPPRKPYFNFSPEKFDDLRQANTNAIVLDVRTPEEYAQGHIHGARLVDFNGPNFRGEIAKLDPKAAYLVHCAAGGRSAKACEVMHDAGFRLLINLDGGLRAWQKAGKPVEK